MAEELVIRFTAEDDASSSIRGLRDNVSAFSSESQRMTDSFESFMNDAMRPAAPIIDEASGSVFNLTRVSGLLSLGLRKLGLSGPAAFASTASTALRAKLSVDTLTVSVLGLELAVAPLLIVVALLALALAGVYIAIKVTGAAIGFLGESFRQALGEQATPEAMRVSNALNHLGNTVSALRSWVGNALLSMFGPALERIIAWLTQTIVAFPKFLEGVINAMIGFLNASGEKVVDWVNAFADGLNVIIRAVNAFRSIIGLKPIAEIGHISWKGIGTVSLPGISLTDKAFKALDKGGLALGGGGGVGGGGGGGGGAGTGAGRRLPGGVSGVGLGSEGVDRLQLQILERVDGKMQELIDLLSKLPQVTRDAIVVYSGSNA